MRFDLFARKIFRGSDRSQEKNTWKKHCIEHGHLLYFTGNTANFGGKFFLQELPRPSCFRRKKVAVLGKESAVINLIPSISLWWFDNVKTFFISSKNNKNTKHITFAFPKLQLAYMEMSIKRPAQATNSRYKLQDTSQPICNILKLPSYKLQISRTDRFSGLTFPTRTIGNFFPSTAYPALNGKQIN